MNIEENINKELEYIDGTEQSNVADEDENDSDSCQVSKERLLSKDVDVDEGIDGCSSPLDFYEAPLSPENKQKIAAINDALDEIPLSREKLQKLALSRGGLVTDDLRRRVWPMLLDINDVGSPSPTQEELEAHPEYHQVVLDVNRSLKRFPPGIPYEQRVALQDQLTRLILRVIMKYPHLRYYQGYHDVAVTFLLVVGESVAFQIMEKLSTEHLKECMEPTMDKTSHLLNYIYPLIQRLHPALHDYMEQSGVGTMFCLPWFLTWYGHSLNLYRDVVRLYDYFLSSPPLLPLYLAATLVVHRSAEIFSVECDMASIHALLSDIPDDLPFEELLQQASDLYAQYPPESILSEVNERSCRELQLRHGGMPRKLRKYKKPWGWTRNIPQWVMMVPLAIPRVRFFRVLLGATVVGLYAYYLHSAEANVIEDIR